MTREEAIADLKEALKEIDTFRKIYSKQRKVSVEYEKRYASLSFVINELEQTRWIPVSERLPKEDGKYLVSRKNEKNIWVEEAYYSTTSRTTFPKGFSIIKDNFSWRINNVIAWMPLPQPYKAESEDKE